jgi:predicted DsbA family dithiol-disulfide isomerase
MQGGEFAKEHGRYGAYHEAVFRAFFTDCQDIGDRSVILDLANGVGLDAVALSAALENGVYMPRVQEASRKAKMNGFSAAPTFVIEGYGAVSGAQPIDSFRKILRGVQESTNPEPLVTMK